MIIFSKKNQKISQCFYDHGQCVVDCFDSFEKFFTELFSDTPDKNTLDSLYAAIGGFEASADIQLRRTVDAVGSSFLPATRSRLINLAQSTDKLANKCQSVTKQLILEKAKLPSALHRDIIEIIKITKGQLELLYKAVEKVLSDFGGLQKDKTILDDMRAEESRVDRIENMLHARLFELDLPLVEKIYYRGFLEHICDLSDTIEDIADQIQIMLIEREA